MVSGRANGKCCTWWSNRGGRKRQRKQSSGQKGSDGAADGGLEDEGVGADDVPRGRRARIGPRLDAWRGAVTIGAGKDVPEYLCVAFAGLPLTPSPEIAASGNEDKQDNHCQDRGQSCRKAGPVDVDKRKSIIGLVDAGFLGVCGRVGADREVRVFDDDDGRRGGG